LILNSRAGIGMVNSRELLNPWTPQRGGKWK
jgi:hypothetical protein